YLILTGHLTPVVFLTALTNGIPYAAQIVISNVMDEKSDAATGRRTLTVLVGGKRAPFLSLAFIALYWGLFTLGMVKGILPLGALLCLVLLPNHVRFLVKAFTGDSANARLLSFQTIRLQLVIVAVAHLLANHVTALG